MIDGCKMKCPFGMGPFLGDMLIYWHIFTAPIVFGDDASWEGWSDDPIAPNNEVGTYYFTTYT